MRCQIIGVTNGGATILAMLRHPRWIVDDESPCELVWGVDETGQQARVTVRPSGEGAMGLYIELLLPLRDLVGVPQIAYEVLEE